LSGGGGADDGGGFAVGTSGDPTEGTVASVVAELFHVAAVRSEQSVAFSINIYASWSPLVSLKSTFQFGCSVLFVWHVSTIVISPKPCCSKDVTKESGGQVHLLSSGEVHFVFALNYGFYLSSGVELF